MTNHFGQLNQPASTCPRCGYCPHCGRGNGYWQSPFLYPSYPWGVSGSPVWNGNQQLGGDSTLPCVQGAQTST